MLNIMVLHAMSGDIQWKCYECIYLSLKTAPGVYESTNGI